MSWIDFESYVFELLKKKFSKCKILVQLRLGSGLRPDFVIECDSELVVIDAKASEVIEKRDVDQVTNYIKELDADYGIIFVIDHTRIPESIENYAISNAIGIEYTDWGTK